MASTGLLCICSTSTLAVKNRKWCDHSSQWTELMAIFIYLANTHLGKMCYNFTEAWVIASDVMFHLLLGKLQTGR